MLVRYLSMCLMLHVVVSLNREDEELINKNE